MLFISIFILGVIGGVIFVWFYTRSTSSGVRVKLSLIGWRRKKKEDNKQKIIGLFEMEKSITNDNVQKLLKISDATATKYLDELEREGKITKVGETGRYIIYEDADAPNTNT